jgi:hypothetical protein
MALDLESPTSVVEVLLLWDDPTNHHDGEQLLWDDPTNHHDGEQLLWGSP